MKQKHLKKHNRNREQRGFTLIEVMLYLAIVGLVIMIGMNALGGRSAQVQFSDSMRDLHGYITSQYSEFVSGIRPYDTGCSYAPVPATRPSVGPLVTSDGTCILFGRVFIFEASSDGPGKNSDQVETYNLVARNITDDTFGDDNDIADTCNLNHLLCLNPHVIDDLSPQVKQILWGVEFIGGNESNHGLFNNSGNPDHLPVNSKIDNVRGFGWLKEPVSNRIIPIVFGSAPGTVFVASTLQADQSIYRSHAKAKNEGATPRAALNAEFNSAFCFRGPNDQVAMLVFGEGESQEVINLTFEESTQTHDCSNF